MEDWLRWPELYLDINHWKWHSQRTIFQVKHFSPLQKIHPSDLICPGKVMCSIFVNDRNYSPSPVITFHLYHYSRLLWITLSPIIPCTVRGTPQSLHWVILADFRQQPDQATFKYSTALSHRVALGQDEEPASHGPQISCSPKHWQSPSSKVPPIAEEGLLEFYLLTLAIKTKEIAHWGSLRLQTCIYKYFQSLI